MDLESTIAEIRYWHRQRNFMMDQRMRSILALGAFLRIDMGWSKHLPANERAAIAAKARAMIKPKGVNPDHPMFEIITAARAARGPFLTIERKAQKEMERLAKTLPAWEEWGEGVRAFGACSFAVIVGEAGDLSKYPTHGHLWKRMGVATINGVRQGAHPKGMTGQDRIDYWKEQRYSPRRRAQMFMIGDCQVKQGERYRQIYLDRKEYERQRAVAAGLIVAPSAKIPKGKEALYISDGHIHRRAQRYTEQRLLRHLWQAWRRAVHVFPERASTAVSSALELAA